MIKLAGGIDSGSLKGKAAVAAYWKGFGAYLRRFIHEAIGVTEGVGSVALYYRSVMNKRSIEVMFFNDDRVNRIVAHYTRVVDGSN